MTGYDQQFGQVSTEEGRISSEITAYWDTHIHDLAITTQPVGTPGFFQELDDYRFDKLQYLPRLVDFSAYRGKTLLEVGLVSICCALPEPERRSPAWIYPQQRSSWRARTSPRMAC